jgi:SAM-dependent methyltransferase
MADPFKLNLGCCDDLRKDYVNVDLRMPINCGVPYHEWDLNITPWPWADSLIDFILAADVIEHLEDPIATMNEMWRVLKPGAMAEIAVPSTEGRGAFQDPNHKSWWNRNSFFYYTDKDPHRERFGDSYGIKARFQVMAERTEYLEDNVLKLRIILKAVKPDANSGTDTPSAS